MNPDRKKAQFRPCIDLHDGKVKQIVGSTLSDSGEGLKTNFVADRSPAWFAGLYRKDNLHGGHVIKLGPGNDEAAKEASRVASSTPPASILVTVNLGKSSTPARRR